MLKFVSKLRTLVRKAILGGVEDADLRGNVHGAVMGGVQNALAELHELLGEATAEEPRSKPVKRGQTKRESEVNGHSAIRLPIQ